MYDSDGVTIVYGLLMIMFVINTLVGSFITAPPKWAIQEMTVSGGEDAHLEAQYEDRHVDDYDEDEEDEPCGLCGGWPCECDAIVDASRDRRADG